MLRKVKRVEILKNGAQSHVEYSDKSSCFELQLLFQVSPESFLQALRRHSRYLGGALDFADYVIKN